VAVFTANGLCALPFGGKIICPAGNSFPPFGLLPFFLFLFFFFWFLR